MSESLQQLIRELHASPHLAVLAVTGGGSGAISQLLEVPGASRTVLEAIVPYASTSLAEWLGSASDQSCSGSTARAMAMASWMRARELAPDANPHNLIGVGATASLASDRPKRGEHRMHVATQTATQTTVSSLTLKKDQRSRSAEESLTSQLVLLSLAEASDLDIAAWRGVFDGQLIENETIQQQCHVAEPGWTELLIGTRTFTGCLLEGTPQAIFSGAFNPPHAGHRGIIRVAEQRLNCQVAYELSITNVDKPPLDFVEMRDRLAVLQTEADNVAIVLTVAPTFRQKAGLFPGCTFVVGADTIQRVGDPKYYTGTEGSFDAAIQQIADRDCRFLVFGREIDGQYCVLSDLTLPPALRALCDEVSAEDFREDVSSTELRGQSTN